MTRYTAQTPGGDRLTGTAPEIADWLQSQDWQWGEAGQEAQHKWRQDVTRRVKIQTGQTIDPAAIVAVDSTDFLVALAAAGTISLTVAD